MARIPQIIVYERTREVYQFMISASKQRKEIVQFFAKKWSDDGHFPPETTLVAKHRTIDNYIRKVKHSFFNFETEIQNEKGRTLARLDDLYSRLIKIQDYKGALQVLKEIGDVVGFKVDPEKDRQVIINITREDAQL